MKELNNDNLKSNKQGIESIQKKQQQVELKHIGSEKPIRGHTLFEINTRTGEIAPAEFVLNKTISWYDALRIQNGTFNYKTLVKPNCAYISALNETSAISRYSKNKGSVLKPSGNNIPIKLF